MLLSFSTMKSIFIYPVPTTNKIWVTGQWLTSVNFISIDSVIEPSVFENDDDANVYITSDRYVNILRSFLKPTWIKERKDLQNDEKQRRHSSQYKKMEWNLCDYWCRCVLVTKIGIVIQLTACNSPSCDYIKNEVNKHCLVSLEKQNAQYEGNRRLNEFMRQ